MNTEDDVHGLFETVRPPAEPSAEVRQRTHAMAYRAWQDIPDRPSHWRRAAPLALAASVAATVVAIYVVQTREFPGEVARPTVAEVLHASGAYSVEGGAGSDRNLVAGATVTTSTSGRVLIRFGTSVALRMDVGSRATLQDDSSVELHDGRVFVDSKAFTTRGKASPARGMIEVTAPGGLRVRNAGTQFQVAVEGKAVFVGVREGRVELLVGGEPATVSARSGVGQVVAIEGFSEVSRTDVPATDPFWSWIHEAHPDFHLESTTVYEFLHWAVREAGLALTFESDAVRQHASMVLLHGPPIAASDISRDEIVEVLDTAPSFLVVPLDDHRLIVRFRRE